MDTKESPEKTITLSAAGGTARDIGPYHLLEKIGEGGMGDVWVAEQHKPLHRRVALKLIKAGMDTRQVIARFESERQALAMMDHPAIAKVFDAGETSDGRPYFVMEYVQGIPITTYCDKNRLTTAERLDLFRHICEGVQHAHQKAIIHRDLKPSNILVAIQDGVAVPKIIDFGVAKATAQSLTERTMYTELGMLIGTPEYMSPEQVEGKDVDQRSDIYSLGIILYEMLTGRVPFEGDTPFTVGVKHKSEAPADPKLINPNIPDDLSGIILKCLEKDRSSRYQSAGDVRTELERVEKGLPTAERAEPALVSPTRKPFTSKEITVKFQPKKLIIPALAAIAVIIAAVIFWPKKISYLDPNLVAVAVFENKTGDPKLEPIGSRAAERIMQGLAQVGGFSVAPMPSAEALAAASKGKDKLRALAEATKAGKIVHGDYFLQGDNLQFHAWVQDMAAKKNIVPLEPATGPAADPDVALEPLRLRLMGGLAGVFDPMMKDSIALLKEPPNFEAFREFTEGIKKQERGEFAQSIPHLLKAQELDPKLNVALIYLGHAYWNQGQAAKADEFWQMAEKSRAELSTYERVFLDYSLALLRGDREANLRTTRQLVAFTPKRALAYYINASAANRINYPREAVAVLSRYNPYDPPYKNWSRNYWGVLTTALHMLGNYKQELKEARLGRKQFPESLSMLANEVDALAALGRTEDLQTLFEESKTLPPMSGYSPGNIMLRAGRELRAHGFKEDAIRVLNQALGWFESRPEQEKASAGNRYDQSRTLYVLERWDEAETMFTALHSESPENINYLGYLGAAAARKGEKAEALQISKELEEDKRPYLYGNPTYWRARIAALLGNKEAAVNLLRQATKEGYAYSSIHPTEDFESLADYPPYIQLMKPKG